MGLDQSRVYRVRDVPIDRAALHISLDNGTIAFTEDVAGRVTGAFFEGEGEVLLAPPNRVERASMALFTGAAILEERFGSAYFRFSDDTYAKLQRELRPAENASEFVAQWNQTARNLADSDAMRLLLSFSQLLPVSGASAASQSNPVPEHTLHARVQGYKLGTFDVFYDERSPEQIAAGQLKSAQGQSYYDVWTSFPVGAERSLSSTALANAAPANPEFTVSQYKVKAEVRPPTTLSAEANLELDVHRGGARAVLFELSRFLQLKGVEADGRPVEYIHNQALEGSQLARRGNDVVAVIFPQPLRAGQHMQLRFTYGGDVLSEAGGGLLYVGARGTWYPNQGGTMSNFDLEFRYPAGWTLLATGKRVEVPAPPTADPGDTTTAAELVSRWVSERAIPVAGFNLGRYERAIARAGEVKVESYAAGVERTFPKGTDVIVGNLPKATPVPEHAVVVVPAPTPSPARNAQAVADRSARALEFFAQRFGPYPYSDLALTQMPGDLSQGWPGLIFLSSFSFLTPREKAQLHLSPVTTVLSNNVVAHETAHQWWGDLVRWRGYRDQWLAEALANYSSLMLLESENPGEFRMVMDKYRDDLLEKNKAGLALMDAGPVTLGTRLTSSRLPGGYEAISYGRGTWLFHMLRYMLRDAEQPGATKDSADEPFVRALRSVRERFAGRATSTQELLRVFEESLPRSLCYEGKKSLEWFYEGWINGSAVPRFSLQNVKYVPRSNSTSVAGTILQKDAPADLVTSIPVYAAGTGKTLVLLGRVFADGPETPFRLKAPAGTRKIVLDPYETVLSRRR